MGEIFVDLTNYNVIIKGMGHWPHLWFRCDVITMFPQREGGGSHLYGISSQFMLVNMENCFGIIRKYYLYMSVLLFLHKTFPLIRMTLGLDNCVLIISIIDVPLE